MAPEAVCKNEKLEAIYPISRVMNKVWYSHTKNPKEVKREQSTYIYLKIIFLNEKPSYTTILTTFYVNNVWM